MYQPNMYPGPGQPQQYGGGLQPPQQQPQQQQQFPGYQQQQQPQQPGNFLPQPTGYGMQKMQPQATAIPGPGQQQSPFQAPFQSSFQQPQQQPQMTGFPPQQSQSFQAPQHTPQQPTSSQVAQSFQQSAPGSTSGGNMHSQSGTKIPTMRLSFITSQDQARFEQLFKSAAGNNQALDSETARDLLLRSKLPGNDLSKIWILSDTTKSGRLMFPEFALAMYLCNLRLTQRDLPNELPEKIRNEVSSMVDIISFGIPDDKPPPEPVRTNVPQFDQPLLQNTSAPPPPRQPQPQQASNSQLLSQLTAQPTGFYNQATGFQPSNSLQPQPTGFPGQNLSLRQQSLGLQSNPQATGYTGSRPPMPPIPSSFANSTLSPSQPTGLPLTAQPTGVPGQWGFVNAPASGLPNIEALRQRLMPQAGREGGFTTAGLAGNATIPWAVTKDEKRIYDDLFRAWDGLGKGFIGGDVAIEIMGQSGCERQDLEKVWTLSDPNNRGRLNMDEFAVAMHLIYRKLNGYPIPNRLPPELVPPSTRNLNDSIGAVKSLLTQDAEARKSSGAFLQPQKTGVSYLKSHSFRTGSASPSYGRKDATVFKNNDDDIGYRSSARRRIGAGRTPSPSSSNATSDIAEEDLTIEQIKKKIREAKIMLDATDFRDENRAEEEEALNRRDRKEAEALMERIRRVQDDIDTDPKAAIRNIDSGAEKRSLRRQLQSYQDQLPELASNVRKTERAISDAALELFRLKDAKANPGSALDIIGTGPGGAITESDRIKARARARMQARAAELSGRPAPATSDDGAATRRLEEEKSRVNSERERNDAMTRDVEESVKEFTASLEDSLRGESENSTRDHERRRWEEALGVEDQIRDFIYDLQRNRKTAKIRKEEAQYNRGLDSGKSRYDSPSLDTNETRGTPPRSTSQSPSIVGNTHEQRVAAARERAQKRIAERMAAAGLKPADAGESFMERQEREKQEREERLRRAEEEDNRREQERLRRLESEQTPVPVPIKATSKKAPPPPPSRKAKGDSDQPDSRKAEQEAALKQEQEAQGAERERLEEEAKRQEEDLAREREAAQARLKALEEQVRQGKVKKQEEKRRKQQAEREAKEKEARLLAQKAELEAAQERERELQRQLESIDDDTSSDEDGPVETTPQFSTPAQSQVIQPPVPTIKHEEYNEQDEWERSSTPVLSSAVASPEVKKAIISPETESRNPYFRQLNQNQTTENQQQSQAEPTVAAPSAEVQSTNPFHRLAQQQESSKSAFSIPGPLERKSRARPEESDDWSVADSEASSDEEEDRVAGGSAKHLASILFGTMAPPRPLSAMDEPSESTTPTPAAIQSPVAPPPPLPQAPPAVFTPTQEEEVSSPNGVQPVAPSMPPPPPPMPGMDAPSAPPPPPPPGLAPPPPGAAPPPPPPPPPGAGAGATPSPPGPPGMGRGALLADIQAGRGLKKVATKDRSAASAGRVL
ncbi:actin organization and endocytosis protein [Myotisia sp. PD_48]|nr:actin organization and endocytosis protein [Myotisia sp. PD_48]